MNIKVDDSKVVGLGISDICGIKKEQLADGRMAVALVSEVIPEQVITIPERIQYPELRKAYDSGTLSQGDIVVVSVQIFDSEGNDKTPDDSVFKMPLDNYVADENKEVLFVVYGNFVESNRPQIVKEEIVEPVIEG